MEMALLERLAVVALWIRQTKKSLLQEVTGYRSARLRGSYNGENLLLLVPESKGNVLEAM